MGGGQDRHVIQMIANASLDAIEEVMRRENTMYLKSVDKFNEWIVSAFVTAGSQWTFPFRFLVSYDEKTDMKFIVLHETKNDDGIKVFFNDLWELYLKVRVHSFYFSGRSGVS
jgi:hypothetical protein